MGFFAVFGRSFDPLVDWKFLPPFFEFLHRSYGRVLAILVLILACVLVIGLLVGLPLAALRLTRVARQHRRVAARSAGVLAVVWVACAALGLQIVTGLPVASGSAAGLAYDQLRQVRADIQDHDVFGAQIAADPYRETPAADHAHRVAGQGRLAGIRRELRTGSRSRIPASPRR
jgi:heme A synthase